MTSTASFAADPRAVAHVALDADLQGGEAATQA
eukprot:SAG11_NODE_116_length_16002_cov_19.164560_22_plen_33_part_00